MPRKLVVRTDRNTHFAFAACTEALADAGARPRAGGQDADRDGPRRRLRRARLLPRQPGAAAPARALVRLRVHGDRVAPLGPGRAALDPPRHHGLLEDRRQRRVRRDVRARSRVPGGPARRLGRGHRRRLRDPARRGRARLALDLGADLPELRRSGEGLPSVQQRAARAWSSRRAAGCSCSRSSSARRHAAPRIYAEVAGFAQTTDAVTSSTSPRTGCSTRGRCGSRSRSAASVRTTSTT